MRIEKYDHPTEDASLPSYVHPALKRALPDVERAYDCWQYLAGCIGNYLPQEDGEPSDAYRGRVDRAVFASFFREAVEMFAGALSRYTLKAPPKTFDEAQDDIDREGNGHRAFFMDADAKVLRDGGCLIMIDMPTGKAKSRAEELKDNRRPYLTIHPRAMVRNWRVSQNEGSEYIDAVTIMELVEVPDGEFGVKVEAHYRIIANGRWKVVKLSEGTAGNFSMETVDPGGEYLDATGQPLTYVPCVWYAPTPGRFGEGDLPMRQVMMYSIKHLRKDSDLDEKTHRCAMPVPVVKGMARPGPGEAARPLTIGPNSVVYLETDGAFTWEEPSASSLAEQRAQVTEIVELIKSQTLSFVSEGANKTATQAGLEMAGTQANLTRMGEQKMNVMQRVFQIWSDYTGETLVPESGLVMAKSLYDRPLTSQDVDGLQKLTGGEQLLSRLSAIEEIQRGGILAATVSPQEELDRIEEEDKARMQAAVDAGLPMPGTEELADDTELPMSPDRQPEGEAPDVTGAGEQPEG